MKGYPTVYITQDSTRSLAQGENAKSAFLPHNETVSKRVYHAWLDMGLSGALEEIVNSMADSMYTLNPFPNDKILDWSKLKQTVDDILFKVHLK